MFASNVAGVLVAESVVLWGIWIFFLVTAALVTVCSRPSPFSVILTAPMFQSMPHSRGYQSLLLDLLGHFNAPHPLFFDRPLKQGEG